MLSPEERQIAEFGAKNGKSRQEVEQAIISFRRDKAIVSDTNTPTTPTETIKEPISNRIGDFIGVGGAQNVLGRVLSRSGFGGQNEGQKEISRLTGMSQEEINKANIAKPTGKELAGAALQTGAAIAGTAIGGPASLAGKAALGAGLGYAYDVGQDLIEGKSALETITPGAATLVGGAVPFAAPVLGALKQPVSRAGQAVADVLPDSTTVQGVKQIGTDIAERVPRFFERRAEDVQQAATKAEKIKTAPPVVANAYKVDLPEKWINTATEANPATKAAYARVVDIAEEAPKKVGLEKNPTIVGGELAGKQYEIIEQQRRRIGQAIGEKVKELGLDKAKANMAPAFAQVDNVLAQEGIQVGSNGKLSFAGKFTPQERTRIQELYDLSREAGDVLSPIQVRDMDQLFSKLQREARFEGVGDILIDVNGNKMSLFRVFRDIYSNQLENLSPELRQLNAQYRNVATLLDDVENSIFKTPNFNATKATDPAEFAKVNLRRIFGESQSSAAYEEIADELDTISRQLGYADASPKDVARFAQELRELYPETIPRTGFSGGFRSGVADLISSVTEAGRIDVSDQRKALRELLK